MRSMLSKIDNEYQTKVKMKFHNYQLTNFSPLTQVQALFEYSVK